MNGKDEFQELWQSHVPQADELRVPNFGLLEDLTASITFPASQHMKWSAIATFFYPFYNAIRQLRFATSAGEEVACWLSIAASVVGFVFLLRKRSAPIQAAHEQTVEEFRACLAREYERQTMSLRWPFVVSWSLACGLLLVAENGRSVRQQGWTMGTLAAPLFVIGAACLAFRFQRSVDKRAVRRILGGY